MAEFGACISEHPIPAIAVGEVAGYILEHGGERADLACIFVSVHHAGALEDIAAAFQKLVNPTVLIGCAGNGIVGPGREVEDSTAISAWFGNVGPVHAARLEVTETPDDGRAISGWPLDLPWVPTSAVVLADPFSFPVQSMFDVLNRNGGFPRIVGGMASAGKLPGTNRLVLNGKVYEDGAVAALIGYNEKIWVETLVSQGCRPIGSPYVVTRAEGNIIYELAGEPALRRLTDMVKKELSDEDAMRAQDGLLVGRVIDEHKAEFGPASSVRATSWFALSSMPILSKVL
jgi:small ligand-binding sensory domain FIST